MLGRRSLQGQGAKRKAQSCRRKCVILKLDGLKPSSLRRAMARHGRQPVLVKGAAALSGIFDEMTQLAPAAK